MARSDLEILAEIKLSNRREFDKQLRSLEQRKVFIDTKRSEQALGRITGKANEFTKSLEASNARVIAFGASVAVIEGVRRAFVELASTVVKVESSLTAINSIFGRSTETIGKFGDELFRIAKNTGQGFDDVAKAAQEFARQGLSVEETLKRTNDALILTRLTTLNTEKAIGGLTAVVNGFASSALTTTDVINKLRAVETQFAVASTDLIEAVSRSASVAQDAGISFDQLLGFITAIKQRTGLGGATIGQGLKTGLTRLNLPTRIQELKELGVAVDESASTFDNLVIASRAISKAQQEGESSLATQIGTVVAGQFQISKLSALFRDLASNQSISEGATIASNKAVNEAVLANEAYNKTIESISNQISANIGQIFTGLGEAGLQDFFKGILSDVNVLLEALQGKDIGGGGFLVNIAKDIILTVDQLKLLGPLAEGFVKVLTGPAFITGLAIIANTLKNVFTQGGASLLQLSGINKVTEKRIANQRVIQSLLSQATASELKQLELASTQAQKEQIILGLLNKQLAIQKALESSSIRTAQSLSRQGVALSGSVVTGDVSRRGRGRGFAGGTLGGAIQSEQRAINNGVGGASSNAQVRVVGAFNYGKGKVGPAVLNSDEILIPNKNGDIVLNRDMAGSSAISSMGGNFARGKIPMGKGMTYKASQDGFRKLLMGNTKFQSVKYYSKSSDSVRQLTGVQHSSMVAQSSKAGQPPPKGYSSWQQYQRENQMVTLRGMQGGEQVTKNIKLSNIRGVKAGGASYIPNFANGRVNIGDREIDQMMKRLRSGQPLSQRQLARVEAGIASGQSFKIPPLLRQAASQQVSMAAQQAARGSGRYTPQTPPSGAGQRERLGGRTPIRVRDAQGRFTSGGGTPQPGPTGFQTFNPPAVIQPSLAEQVRQMPPPKEDFSGALENRRYEQFKRDFTAGKIPSGDDNEFKKFKRKLRLELVEAELQKEARSQGKESLTFEQLRKTPEGKKLASSIVRSGLINFKQIEATTARAVQETLLLDAQTQLEKSGKGRFGLDLDLDKRAKSILQSPTGRRLDAGGRARFQESIDSRKIARSQRLQGAGFGLSFVGSLAAPLIGQGVAGATGSERAGAITSGILGGAATGASVGSFTGNPLGVAIGAGAGAILGGVTAALSSARSEGDKYAELLDKQREFFKSNVTAMQTYVSAQSKLTQALESGRASGQQVANLFEDLQQVFNQLQSDTSLSPQLRQRFISGTPREREQILAETQRRGAGATRFAETQAAFSAISERAGSRKATIAAEITQGYSPMAGVRAGSVVTNKTALELSKFTEQEVSTIIGGLLAEVNLDNVDFDKLEESGDRLGKLLAIGIPEKVAQGLSIQLEGDTALGALIDREFKNNNIGKRIQEQLVNRTVSELSFALQGAQIDTSATQRNLFQAQAGQAAAGRITTRGETGRQSQLERNRLDFLSGLGFDQRKSQEQLQISDIRESFRQGVEDIGISLAPTLDSFFKDRLGAMTSDQRSELAPLLEKTAVGGVTPETLTSLLTLTDDKDLKNDLIGLQIELAKNRDALVNNTNQELRSVVALTRQIEEQRIFKAALNDLSAGIGQTLPELFGRDKAQTSITEEIRVAMRDSLLGLDSSTLPGIGRDITRETLQDTSSPEAVALQGAAEVIRTQLELLTRSISEGGLLTEDESRVARSVMEESFSRTGGVSATQAERSDISGRTQQALQDMSDAGVDISTLVSETDIFLKGLDSTVTGLSESSTILSNILSAVDIPDEGPIPSVEGGESSALADSLAGALTAAQSQEAAAKIQLEAVTKFSNDFNNGIISIGEFTEKAGALSQALVDGVNVVNETIAEVTLLLPEGEVRRLSAVEESVERVSNTLREFIDNNLN
jgi:TP901 family phage tail tape measure protein